MIINITPGHVRQITNHAEQAYPNESCGMIAGWGDIPSGFKVTRIAPSTNVSQSNLHDSFEVDPQIRFNLMQDIANTKERIIGHYHSHPDHRAMPSQRDLKMVYEPELIWLITSVSNGLAQITNAFLPELDTNADVSGFEMLEIKCAEWHEIP